MAHGLPTAAYPGAGEYCSALNTCSQFQNGFRLRNYYDRSYATGAATDSDTPSQTTFNNPNGDFPDSLLGPNNGQSARVDGYFEIATAGTYSFYFKTDDFGKLFINGALFLDNPNTSGCQLNPIFCQNHCYQYSGLTWESCVHSTCIDCSGNILTVDPTQITTFSQFVSETPFQSIPSFQSSIVGCPIINYELLQGGIEYLGTDIQIDPTTGLITVDLSQEYTKTLTVLVIGVNGETTQNDFIFQVSCGPLSVSIVAPLSSSYTANQIQPIVGPDYTYMIPPVTTYLPIANTLTSLCDPITYKVLEPDGITSSTFFENLAVLDSSTSLVILTLKPEYHGVLNTYAFSLLPSAKGGAELATPIQGTLQLLCGVLDTTVNDPATASPQIQYGSISISSSMNFQLNAYSSSTAACVITDYLVSNQNPTIDPPPDLTSPVGPFSDPILIRSQTTVDKNHLFYVRVSADGGAFKWSSSQFNFKIGCGTHVNVYLTTDFVQSQTFELMITDPAYKYEILGFVSESPYCQIAKYELIPVENTDGLAFPHQDGVACNPTELQPPICNQACPAEIESPPVCSISALSTENGLQCTAISSLIGICNKIQVITQEVKVMKFKIRAYIGDLSLSAIDTSAAGFKESPLVTVSTICGFSSTSIISLLSSVAHPSVSSGNIDIFLDESNIAGSLQRFDLFFDKMSSTNKNCPIISYQISSTSTTPINLISNPNLLQPTLTQDGYTIELFTGLLQQYQFYIIANADGGATNLNLLPPQLTVNIICGSEMISHDLNLPNLITSINSEGVQAIELMITRNLAPTVKSYLFDDASLTLSSVFRTDKSQCGVVRYEVFSDSSLQTRIVNDLLDPDVSEPFKIYNEDDPTLAQFKFFDSGPYFKNVYIKGISQGNKYSVVPITVAVCGFEKVLLNEEKALILTYKQDSSSSGKFLEWSDIDNFFKFEKGPYSLDQCNSDLTKLYIDQNGQFERTSLDITNQVDIKPILQNQIKLEINDRESFSEQHFYLARITKGLSQVMKHIIVEVCGHEKVLLSSQNDQIQLEYSSTKRDSNPYSFEDYKKYFKSSSNNCKITKYELVSTLDGIPYQQNNIELGPDFSIKVNEGYNFKSQNLYIKASTEQGLYPAYLPLQITVDFEQSQELKNALNIAPNFDNSPNNTMIYITNSTSLTQKINLSGITDDEEKPVEMQIISEQVGRIIFTQETSKQKFSPLNSQGIILEYEAKTQQLLIHFPNKELMQGSQFFEILLTDIRQKTRKYSFKVDFIEQDQSFLEQLMTSEQQKKKSMGSSFSVTAYIQSIDFYGNMIIKFSSQMRTEIVNITELNSTYFDLYIAPSNTWHELEPTFNISNLNFTWNVTAYERDEMHVKLNFTSPQSISLKKIHDSVVFHIKNSSYFFQNKEKPNDYLNELFYTLKRKIPRQILETENVKMIKQATLGFKSMMKTSLVGSFVLNIFIAGSLNQLLGFINSLQLILHLPIMNVKLPASSLGFFQIVLPIVLFDILENIEYVENIFGEQNEDSIVLDQMKQLGYESTNTILNLKTILVLMIVYFLRLIFLLVLIIIVRYLNKGKKLQQSLQKQVIFKEFIYLFTEGYIEFLLSGLIGLQVPQDSQNDIFIVHVTTYVVNILTLVVLPGMIIYILVQPIETLKSEEFKNVWFASYSSFKLSEGKSHLFTHFIFVLRRIIFVTLAFKLEQRPYFQIQILLFLSTFTMMYQGYFDPYIERSKNRIEFFNEICIYICSVHLVCFTLFVPDNEIQNSCGWSLICFICLNTLVNMFMFFKKVFWTAFLIFIKYKRRCQRKIQQIIDVYFTNEQENIQEKDLDKQDNFSIKEEQQKDERRNDEQNQKLQKNDKKSQKIQKNPKQSLNSNMPIMIKEIKKNVIRYEEPEIRKSFLIGGDIGSETLSTKQDKEPIQSFQRQKFRKEQEIQLEAKNLRKNPEFNIPQSRYQLKPRNMKKKKKKKKFNKIRAPEVEEEEEKKQCPQYSEAFLNSALYLENFKPQMEIFEKFRAQRRQWQLEEEEREQRKVKIALNKRNRYQQSLSEHGIDVKYKSQALRNSKIKPN